MFRTILYILIATIVDTLTEDVNTETLTTTTLMITMITFGNVELDDKFSQTTTR